MVFTKFVEIGRLCLVNFGPDQGKLCVILDVVDNNRVLVDGPEQITGVARQALNMKRITLTKFKIDITRGARVKQLREALKKDDVIAKFRASRTAKVIALQKTREQATDFDRFKLMLAKNAKRRVVNASIKTIKAAGKKKA